MNLSGEEEDERDNQKAKLQNEEWDEPEKQTGLVLTDIRAERQDLDDISDNPGGGTVEDHFGAADNIIVREGQILEEQQSEGFQPSIDARSVSKGVKEHWRCYHCWTNLASERATCPYCEDNTIARMFEPT